MTVCTVHSLSWQYLVQLTFSYLRCQLAPSWSIPSHAMMNDVVIGIVFYSAAALFRQAHTSFISIFFQTGEREKPCNVHCLVFYRTVEKRSLCFSLKRCTHYFEKQKRHKTLQAVSQEFEKSNLEMTECLITDLLYLYSMQKFYSNGNV